MKNKFKCPDSIEELEELDKLIPLCRKDLFAQAEARIETGAACSLHDASEQLGTELDRNPKSIERSLQREQAKRGVTLSPLTQKYKPPQTSYQKEIIKEHQQEKKEGRVKRAEEIKEKRNEIAKAAEGVVPSDKWSVCMADIDTWEPPRQYDFIITDPPYPKEYLPLYETLALKAVEWLKPGGLLVAMCGQSYLDDIYRMVSKHIKYYWTASYLTPGQPTPLRQINVNTTWKPLLIFCNGEYNGKIFGDVFKSDGNDKSLHEWGQSISGMYSIINMMCLPGQYILDPFCGAGTTGLAALQNGCLFDGIDINEENVKISTGRLAKHDTEKE